MLYKSDWEKLSGEDDDKDFTVATLANKFESSDDNIENGVTLEPANKLSATEEFQVNIVPKCSGKKQSWAKFRE